MQNHWTLITVILTIKLLSVYAADNEIPTECPQIDPINTTIHIAHELDCSKFYACSNGHKILMICPLMDGAGNRLHFNPNLQVCDWPYHAGCNVTASTTAIPTESTSVGTDNSTEWVVQTESTEANSSSEITETTTEVITESSTSENSTITESSGSNSTVTQVMTTSTSTTVHQTDSTSRPPESTSVTTQKPPVSNSTETEAQPSATTESTVQETEPTSNIPESTSITTQKTPVNNSTETEVQPSATTESTIQETEPTSETTDRPSESTSTETEDPKVTSSPTEITSESTISSTFLTSSTPQVITTNQTEIITTTTTTQIINITNPTIITTDDIDSNETISTLPTPLPECTSNISGILYPHESDCSLFYNCDYGKLVLLSCAEGLYFDESSQICVWPHETNCQKSTSLNPSTNISSISTTPLTPTSTNISDLCPTDNSNDGVLYPHECVCSKFYECSNGQLVLNQCPDGLNFNFKLNICDWPENVQCQSSSSSVSSTTTKLSTSTLSSLVETIKPIEPNLTESSNLIEQQTVSKSECPEDGSEPQLPHETNCRLYYECKDGQKWLKECSSGLEFNPTLQFCDRPELAGCSNSESNQGTTRDKIETSAPVNETSKPVVESSTLTNEISTSVIIASSTLSSNTCLRPCPVNDPIDYTVLIEHENCSKFCKCSNGIPYILNCPPGLQFNSLEQTCDYPERANCQRQPAY